MISVCMATYNGGKYIKEQIDSILLQLKEEDELVISDDGSIDNTVQIIKSYSDPRIRLFFHSKPSNQTEWSKPALISSNFENALRHAKGDFIFLSDQDDIWLSNKVEISLSALKKADLVLTNCSVVDEKGETLIEDFFSVRKTHIGFLRNLWKNTYLGCCMAFRRDFLNIIMPLPKNLPIYQDGWIGALIDICGTTKIETSICMYYRRHLDNVSSTSEKSKLSLLQKIRVRVLLFYLVIRRICFIKWNSGL